MLHQFKIKLLAFLMEQHPDLVMKLQASNEVGAFLETRVQGISAYANELLEANTPDYIFQELCFAGLIEDLLPSKFHYIKEVLEDEFFQDYERLSNLGILTYEVVNMLEDCESVFAAFDFSVTTENQPKLRHAIIAQIHAYLN